MTQKLLNALQKQKKKTKQDTPRIYGLLGIPLGGTRIVEVPNRNSYVYVRLRNNTSEVIQAFNNEVAPSYNLPVIVERRGNRYMVMEVNTERFENNWPSFSPYLPRHGNTHSFDTESGGGGDMVWVYPRQFMPSLIVPSGSLGAPNVIMSSYSLQKADGTWKYTGITGTQNITPYRPTSASGTTLVLVYLDALTGNPSLLFSTGTFIQSHITGASQLTQYFPAVTSPTTQIPLSVVRLVTGTTTLSWDNIYDVRQFIHTTPTGTGGGNLSIQDEGVSLGTATILNVVSSVADISVAGGVARLFITGSAGGSTNLTGTYVGTPNKLVLSNSSGFLTTEPSLGWGVSAAKGFIEFGADVAGKETNAGKMGYQVFDTYLNIVGAGTSAGNRTVKIYDNLIVSSNTNSSSYTLPGVTSKLLSTDGSGNFQSGEPLFASGTYGRKDQAWESVIPENGWIFVSEDWTRTSNHSFSVSGDVASKYRKGTKVKYNDPAQEFGVVRTSAHTTGTTNINLIPNSDYAMASTFISGRYISYVENPEEFPDEFSFMPSGLVTIGNGTQTAYWHTADNRIDVHGNILYGSTTAFDSADLVLPVAMLSSYDVSANITPLGVSIYLDAGTASYLGNMRRQTDSTVRFQAIGAGGTWATTSAISSTVPFTWGSTDEIGFQFSYLF